MVYRHFDPWATSMKQEQPIPNLSDFSRFSNLTETDKNSSDSRASLENKKTKTLELLQACLKVRLSPEYRTFSSVALKAEQDAINRLNQALLEIDIALAVPYGIPEET